MMDTWGVPQKGVPPNGWFIRENLTISGNLHIIKGMLISSDEYNCLRHVPPATMERVIQARNSTCIGPRITWFLCKHGVCTHNGFV